MAMQEPQPEPSMEEILASIRRIISEEDQPAASAAPAPVLELSEPADDLDAGEDDDLVVYDQEPTPAPEPAAPPPQPVRAAAPPKATEPAPSDGPIVSEPAVSAAAGAFTRLAGSLRIADAPGQTIEGMVRELIRPMLKEWLDANLPSIVEAKVEQELDRISRLAR